MAKCIYCRSELNQNQPPDDFTYSKEHIIPYALGGSDVFSTRDASTKYNSELGRDIDSKFVNLLPLSIKRHMHQIAGHSGKIPPIRWKAKSLQEGDPATITINADGQVDYTFDTVFVKDTKKTHEDILVGASPDQMRRILVGMLQKASKKGKACYSQTGKRISQLEDFEPYFEIAETSQFHSSVVAFDFEIWTRGIFKIILGLGHVILGPNWTFSADGGDRIRTVLFCDRIHWPAQSLNGFLTGELPEDIRRMAGITPVVRQENKHTLAILPLPQETVAIISLFGGDNIPEAMVSLGGERGNLAVVNDTMNRHTRVGVQINPTTRTTKWITVADLCQAVE